MRVWTPSEGERPEGVRGTAVHLRSGRRVTFAEPDSLIRFLVEAAGSPAAGQQMSGALSDPTEE